MYRYVFRRILMLIPVLVGVSFVIFTMMYITPGDPARTLLGADATEEAVHQYREEMGLNDPYLVQYGRYLRNALRGDFGISYITRQPVVTEIMSRFPTTLLYAFMCSCVAMLIGIPLGILSATKQYSIVDKLATFISLIGVSMPTFWLGILLIILFSVKLGWLPSSGFYGPKYWILPSLTIGMNTSASIMRMTRSSMLEVIRQDYITTARSKGQRENVIVVKHALRNALIPVVTIIGLQFGRAMGGAIISEQIFSIPGLGKLMVEAIKNRNYPIVQGGVLFIAIAFSIINLFIDLLYAYIDPRLKSQYETRKRKPVALRGNVAKGGVAQ